MIVPVLHLQYAANLAGLQSILWFVLLLLLPMVHLMATLGFCVIYPYAHRSGCTALAKSRHVLQLNSTQLNLRTVGHSHVVSVNAATIYVAPVLHPCSIKQTDTSLVGLQVLRDLGISETRLQNGLVEVWNKTDLLPSAPPADSHLQLPPTCEASDEPASTGAKQGYDMCKHLRKGMRSRMLLHTRCNTCNPLQIHLRPLLQRTKGSV